MNTEIIIFKNVRNLYFVYDTFNGLKSFGFGTLQKLVEHLDEIKENIEEDFNSGVEGTPLMKIRRNNDFVLSSTYEELSLEYLETYKPELLL